MKNQHCHGVWTHSHLMRASTECDTWVKPAATHRRIPKLLIQSTGESFERRTYRATKASSHVSLVCEIHKAHPSQFFTSWLCKRARPAYLKIALRFPHLFVGQLVLFVHTYHICNNHVIYIVAMWLYFSPLWQLLSVATMNSSAQLSFQDRNQEPGAM